MSVTPCLIMQISSNFYSKIHNIQYYNISPQSTKKTLSGRQGAVLALKEGAGGLLLATVKWNFTQLTVFINKSNPKQAKWFVFAFLCNRSHYFDRPYTECDYDDTV